MAIEDIICGAWSSLIDYKKSGKYIHLLVGAGAMGVVSLVLTGLPSFSSKAAENLKPKVDTYAPAGFDYDNGKLHIRYEVGEPTTLNSKKSPNGVTYFQGREGKTVLIPAELDKDGNLRPYN